MDSPFQHELNVVFEAIQVATQISRTVLGALQNPNAKDDSDLRITKTDLSPVTVADLAIQTVLVQVLSAIFPTHAFVAEESASELRRNSSLLATVQRLIINHARESPFVWSNGGSNLQSEENILAVLDGRCTAGSAGIDLTRPTWVIDPIDGTEAFLRGEQYAINVALLLCGRQQLSVVACPLLALGVSGCVSDDTVDPSGRGCLLFAVRGYGAYVKPLSLSLNPDAGEVVRRLLRRDGAPPSVLRGVTSYNDWGLAQIHAEVTRELHMPLPMCNLTGWVPRWVILALGLADVTVWVYRSRERFAKIWDHAGAMLLFEEVGGMITDVNGREIDLSRGRLLNGNFGFVAAPRAAHYRVLAATRDATRRHGRDNFLEGDES